MKTIKIFKLIVLIVFPLYIFCQDSIPVISSVNHIPKALLDKIPRHQKAEFILARQNALEQNPLKGSLNFLEELGISAEVFNEIPNDQLIMFLNDIGYIHFKEKHHTDNSPTPEQALKLLYLLIGGIVLITILGLALYHFRRIGEQKIVVKALETGTEIPLEFLKKNKRKSYLQIAIILLIPGLGFLFFGRLLNLPFEFSLPIVFLALGFFAASRITN